MCCKVKGRESKTHQKELIEELLEAEIKAWHRPAVIASLPEGRLAMEGKWAKTYYDWKENRAPSLHTRVKTQ